MAKPPVDFTVKLWLGFTKSILAAPVMRGSMSEQVTMCPCRARTLARAPSPQAGSQMRFGRSKARRIASVAAHGVG